MKYFSRIFVWSMLFFVAARPAPAQVDFSRFVTFGDSLTHNDPLWLVNGDPPALYGADPFEGVFIQGARPGDELIRPAVAGSESVHLLLQVAIYERRRAQGEPPATLIGLEIGGNDILNNDDLLAAQPPLADPEADAVIDRLIDNVFRAVFRLQRIDPHADFVLWTVPDVTVTPNLWDRLSAEEVLNLQAHTERANALIREFDALPSFAVIDLYALIQQTIAEPPEVAGEPLVPPPFYGDFDHLFADDIHPTAVTNALLANAIIDALNQKWDAAIPPFSEDELAELARREPAPESMFRRSLIGGLTRRR